MQAMGMAQMQRPQPLAHHSARGPAPIRTRFFGRQPAGTRARRHCAALQTRASPTVALGDSYKEESRKYRRAGPSTSLNCSKRLTCYKKHTSRCTRLTLRPRSGRDCV